MPHKSLTLLLTTALLTLAACASSPAEQPDQQDKEQQTMPDATQQPSLEGTWQGPLTVPGAQLTLVFHLDKTDDGTWNATMDSPDQGATGIPVSAVEHDGDKVTIAVVSIGGVFTGTLSDDGTAIDGEWSQGSSSLPLDLERTEAKEAKGVNRPQNPEPPFPYTVEEVKFAGGEPTKGTADAVQLAGTLTLPEGEGPHPAVVLLTGSGPQDRDEALAGHRPFWVLADYLTRHGVAVLRFDDRGVGESTGTFEDATIADFTQDAIAAAEFMAQRDDIKADAIGLVGHSEGANVAPRASNASDKVAFIVLLAPTAVPGHELLARQNRLVFEGLGMSAEGAQTYEKNMHAVLRKIVAVPLDKPVPDELRKELRADFNAAIDAMSPEDLAVYGVVDDNTRKVVLDQLVGQLTKPWMRSFLAMTPQKTFQKVDVPTLALFGAKDVQVSSEQNAPVLEEALGDDADATVETLEGLNHLFQPANTGLPAEYSQIETTLSPKMLETLVQWMAEKGYAEAGE
ncbi:alpha/beta hydrolase [Persicimonas caeni]|uniref:Alpha/beta hydrolase n=1 Tax=Persicimonas caeni TaxID=2292766 RepID=A0A4Y6PLP3_PERCE|nr:alpha/beta fold hydrolase [Persicimonas caeni]QDG49182.1 alpha/beta hydrolase [Persicimonas caeni]QED30403.1 alpha/beta hydrolase [Persicimonas caeni]